MPFRLRKFFYFQFGFWSLHLSRLVFKFLSVELPFSCKCLLLEVVLLLASNFRVEFLFVTLDLLLNFGICELLLLRSWTARHNASCVICPLFWQPLINALLKHFWVFFMEWHVELACVFAVFGPAVGPCQLLRPEKRLDQLLIRTHLW